MANQRLITLYAGAAIACNIILRPLPVADLPVNPVCYLRPISKPSGLSGISPTLITLRVGETTPLTLRPFSKYTVSPPKVIIVLRNFLAPSALPTGVTYTYASIGGIQYSGSATLAKLKALLAQGGTQIGGGAIVLKDKSFLGGGGLQSGGVATTSPLHIFTYIVGGGLQYAGTASLAKVKTFLPGGGLQINGSGNYLFVLGTNVWIYTANGGLQYSGKADVAKLKEFLSDGGLQFSGNAVISKIKSFLSSGGIQMGGGALTNSVLVHLFIPSGGLRSGGFAILSKTKCYIGSGGLTPIPQTIQSTGGMMKRINANFYIKL